MSARTLGTLDLHEALDRLWKSGLPPGDKTGWPSLDKHYTVAPGQMTIVTGWPSSGKSEWLDALLVNLWLQDWKFAIFSPENRPLELHLAKLFEKVAGKPFGAGPTERISREDVQGLISEFAMQNGFLFLDADDGTSLTCKEVVEAAAPWLEKRAKFKRGLVIDPWNELEHWRPRELSETEYVSKTLSYLRNWARKNQVHVWVVAHPQKMPRENGRLPIPRPDMISGSQHWWNKADAAITVWRDMEDLGNDRVDIHVQKVRFKNIGRPGLVELRYDRVTGRYSEYERDIYAVKGPKK